MDRPETAVETKLTSQGQVSVPAAVRRLLQLRPGSTLVWRQDGDRVVVSRAVRHGTADVHRALFGTGGAAAAPAAPAPTANQLKEGVRQRMRERHARR